MPNCNPKIQYWCMSCGCFDPNPCEEIGHISRKTTSDQPVYGPTTVAVNYLGNLRHIKIKLPGE